MGFLDRYWLPKKKAFLDKVREMQNSSEVFKSNFDYYQRVAHKKLSKKNVLLDFPTSLFPAGGPS
jgi:hypothetical protein